jgi:uncharacterized protein
MLAIYTLYKKTFVIGVALIFTQLTFGQFTIPEKPTLQTSVYDYANVLSSNQKTALEQKLIQYSDSTSTQIVIATVETINGEDIGILTPKWAHEWGIGQLKEDNGVFILLAIEERKIWIAPGYGVEHKLTAGTTGSIVRDVIIPEFKRGDYYAGLEKGTYAIFEVLNGTYINENPTENQGEPGFPRALIILIVFIVLMIIFSKKNKGGGNGGNRNDATDILTAILLSRAGRGGFGGGSFGGGSSGGFGGGFGGGGFSGGGAGGSW